MAKAKVLVEETQLGMAAVQRVWSWRTRTRV